jgi:hypothetical protein
VEWLYQERKTCGCPGIESMQVVGTSISIHIEEGSSSSLEERRNPDDNKLWRRSKNAMQPFAGSQLGNILK